MSDEHSSDEQSSDEVFEIGDTGFDLPNHGGAARRRNLFERIEVVKRHQLAIALSSLVVGVGLHVVGLTAQALSTPRSGPVIDGYGAVYAVPDVDYDTPVDHVYRVVFDVSGSAESPDQINASINTLARFLNMHAQAGVPPENLQLALVLHGGAGKDALHHDAYRKRFGMENPNLPLLEALQEAGVRVYLCGQTASHRGYPKKDLAAPVQLALSAMTALVTLQAEGYELVAF